MDVLDARQFACEPGEVVLLGEARELRPVVEADVDEAGHACALQEREELLGRLSGESNRVDGAHLVVRL